MEAKVARAIGRRVANQMKKKAAGIVMPGSPEAAAMKKRFKARTGRDPIADDPTTKVDLRDPKQSAGFFSRLKSKPKTSKVAYELGKLVGEATMEKSAAVEFVNEFRKNATEIGKKMGLSNDAIDDMILKSAQAWGYGGGMPGMYGGGMPGMYGGMGGGGNQYQRQIIPGMTMSQLQQGPSMLSGEWWKHWGESPTQMASRRVKEYYTGLGQKVPGGPGSPGAAGKGGAGGAGGAGGGQLYTPAMQKMFARGGWNPQQYNQQMELARDMGMGTQSRAAVGKAFRNMFNAGTGLWN